MRRIAGFIETEAVADCEAPSSTKDILSGAVMLMTSGISCSSMLMEERVAARSVGLASSSDGTPSSRKVKVVVPSTRSIGIDLLAH